MAGTKEGAQKAKAKVTARYGADFYRLIGSKGGRLSRHGGFAANRELAAEMGRRGGTKSRRTGVADGAGKTYKDKDGAVHRRRYVWTGEARAERQSVSEQIKVKHIPVDYES